MRRNRRVADLMTRVAKLRVGVVHDQKLAELIVVSIVTTRALHFGIAIQPDLRWQRSRGFDLGILTGKGRVVAKGDGMIIPEVRTDVRLPRGQRGNSTGHRDGLVAR